MSRPRQLGARLALGLACLLGSRLPGLAGQTALYLSLGVFPGMALGALLAGRAPGAPRWTLGLALAPLASSGAGALLLGMRVPLPTAALATAAGGWLLWLLLGLRAHDETAPAEADAADVRFTLGLGLGLALIAALPWLVNRWILVRSDGWIHAGLVWEIVHHGIPPQDPRFAGLAINFMWFYNLFIAMLASLGRRDPFVFMTLFNTLNLAVCAALAYRIALELWRDRTSARGAALLTVVGLNAGTWLLWPFGLLRSLVGETRGWADAQSYVANLKPGTCSIIFNLPAPGAHFVFLLDKFTVGTSLSYAWLLMAIWLWSLVRWLEHGRQEALALAAVSAAGMFFMHTVVGASVVPVGLATLALAWLARPRWPWLPSRSRLAALAAVTLCGALLAAPYTWSISRGWAPGRSGFRVPLFQPSWAMAWTLVSACAVTFWFARRPLGRVFRERLTGGAMLALFILTMTVFALLVHLRLSNETKFVFQVFIPLALFGGATFLPDLRAFVRRRGRWVAVPVLALLFLCGPALMLQGYCADPEGRTSPRLHPGPGEQRLYAWIRERTPAEAVFVDARGRDLILVLAERRLWVGTTSVPELAAFPVREMEERRAVEADLFGSGADLEHSVRSLARLRQPVYVLFRPDDFPGQRPWTNLERPGAPFDLVYDRDGFRVYQLRS